MGLCDVVASLADAVAAKYPERGGWDNLLIHILRSAPVYRDGHLLNCWDEAYRDAREALDHSTPVTDLVDAICELGCFNLYGAFNAPSTRQEYDRVAQTLRASGVQLPPEGDISDW